MSESENRSFKIIYQLPIINPTKGVFSHLIKAQQVAVSSDGQTAASVQKGIHSMDVVFCQERLSLGMPKIHLLDVGPERTVIWGKNRHEAKTGVYSIRNGQVDFIERLDCLERYFETPAGLMVKGTNVGDPKQTSRYILPDADSVLVLDDKDSVSITRQGVTDVLTPCGGGWYHLVLERDANFKEGMEFSKVDNVTVVAWRDGYVYTLQRGPVFTWFAPGLDKTRQINGIVEFAWSSPDQKHVVHLVRDAYGSTIHGPCLSIYFDGEFWDNGYVHSDKNSISWSPDNKHFVLKASCVVRDKFARPCVRDVLITSTSKRYRAPLTQRISEALVDDNGEIAAFVLSNSESHQLYSYDEFIGTSPFIWNLSSKFGGFFCNRLVDSAIVHSKILPMVH